MADSNGGAIAIRAQPILPGYVVFGLAGGAAAPEQLPPLLSKAVSQ